MFWNILHIRSPFARVRWRALIAALLLAMGMPYAMAEDVLKGASIRSGELLRVGEMLISPSREFFLATQSDGNLCVYHEFDGSNVWCSRSSSAGEGDYVTGMQTDGNVCTSRSDGRIAWCLTDRARYDGPFFLAIQDDANLCVYRGVPGAIVDTVWCSMALAQPKPHGPQLLYGYTYHLQNGYHNWAGGYLDVRGGPCNNNALCVSTADTLKRDGGSGTWVITSAEGKPAGTPVMRGERVFLKNKYRLAPDNMPPYDLFGGYLDTRGTGCQDNPLCVSTSITQNTGFDSSIWTFGGQRHSLYVGQPLHVQNKFPSPNGLTYLDVRGGGCSGNVLCVSASVSADRDQGSGWWRLFNGTQYYAERYAPRLRFDGDAHGYPMSAQTYYQQIVLAHSSGQLQNTNIQSLGTGTIPTYYQVFRVGSQMRIRYWWFYGYQSACFGPWGTHNGDWESVTVIIGDDQVSLAAVVFDMHGDYYTRLAARGGFAVEEGTHPVVYVGKDSHASFFGQGGTSSTCIVTEEWRNNSNGSHLDSWTRLIDLDSLSEPWMVADKATPIVWGNDGVSTGPTRKGPTATMNAAYWEPTIETWRFSQCKRGDTDVAGGCLRQCRAGYTDMGMTCTAWSGNWDTYIKSTYGFDYTLPTDDRGLLYNDR